MFGDVFTRLVCETKGGNVRSILYREYKYRIKYFKTLEIEYRTDKTHNFVTSSMAPRP